MDALLEAGRGNLLRRAVGLHAVSERSGATEGVVELGVRLPVAVGVALGDPDVEVGLHLVDEPDLLTREFVAGARQRPQVRPDERRPRIVESRGEFGQQPLGLAGQVGGVRLRLGSDRALEGGVTGERVDVAFLDSVEAQSEHQVLGHHGGRSCGIDTYVHAALR